MKKLTHEQFLGTIPKNITIVDRYINSRTKITAICNTCNNKWLAVANSLKYQGCPKCGKEISVKTKKWNITHEDFLYRIPRRFLKTITILDKYKSYDSKIKVQCKICTNIWESRPRYLYKKQGCAVCSHKKQALKTRKSNQKFEEEIKLIHRNRVVLLEKYTKGCDKISVKCSLCNHYWKPIARTLLRRGCPNCNISKGEIKIKSLLDDNHIPYIQQYKFQNFTKYKFDFAILENNKLKSLIEYDGKQHFEAIEYMGGQNRLLRQQLVDKKKNEYCKLNNIKLIRIPYWDYSKISLETLGLK